MFFTNYVEQCNKKGLSPSAAAEAMGFQRSVVTRWSKGTEPRAATLQKIASFFGCSVEDLQKEKPTTDNGSGFNPEYYELTDENRALVDDLIAKLLKSQSAG